MSDMAMPMAWNEPGNKNDKNPWGNNRKNDGPPDLDEIIKKFAKKFKNILGGSGNNSDGFGFFMLMLLGVFAVIYVFAGFYTVSPYEQVVVTRFGKYERTVSSGLHWHPKIIEAIQRVRTENISSSRHGGEMLTKDENIISVEVEVHYRILDSEKYLFNVVRPEDILREAADSALRQVIGNSTADDVLTEQKFQIAEKVRDNLESSLTTYDAGFKIQTVNFKNSAPPEEVKGAFDDVINSREDRERIKLEAWAYSNKVIPEAQGSASKLIAEAQAYKQESILNAMGETKRFDLIYPQYIRSPKITKNVMYLDSMQQVLSSTSKIIMDGDANNLALLPLDTMLNKASKEAKETVAKTIESSSVNAKNRTRREK